MIYEPVELETGPNPQMIRFYVECVIPHSSGRITYAADDLFFFPRSFVEFADQLKEVLDGTADEAVLAPPGDELALTIHRVKKELRMQISVNEFKASYSPTTFSGSGWVAMDVAYRWARELKEEYSQRLNEWILEQTVG